jgi:hypothetical protein
MAQHLTLREQTKPTKQWHSEEKLIFKKSGLHPKQNPDLKQYIVLSAS